MPQDFDDFYLKEYERISEAYFSTMNSIAQFIGFYLAVASLPPAAVVIFGKPADSEAILTVMKGSPLVLGLLPLFGVSLVGTFLAAYVIALRHDATLYARSVNGVRAYFVAKANPKPSGIVLPIDTGKPSFRGSRFVLVVIAVAIVNAGYALAGAYLYGELVGWPLRAKWLAWLLPLGIFCGHFVALNLLARREEKRYGA